MRFLKALWLTVFFFCSLIFFIQNNDVLSQKMTLKFDFYYFDYVWTNTAVPFFFVILVAFVAGALVTLGYLVMDRMRLKMELSRCRRVVRKQEKELKKLRSIPLEPTPIPELPEAEKTNAA
ncbi:Histidine triad (HIT) protein [uncultured delta proteobacterium]|uniref:Histidine triad (HIT) protein n=1 Tax=uncultured delta proteobacterium TaxID=34034 RepID=A0A212J455_9DELT|nr:Histidine triad (HIT) protein [uncultured delta proteobacterium]